MSSLVGRVTWAPNTLSPLGHPAPHWGGVTYRGGWEQSGVPKKDVLVTWAGVSAGLRALSADGVGPWPGTQ